VTPNTLKVYAGQDDAGRWFKRHDPVGVAFEYPVVGELVERVIRMRLP